MNFIVYYFKKVIFISKMNFQQIRNQLNQKLVEICAYRKYTTPEEKLRDKTAKRFNLYRKLKVLLFLPNKNIQLGAGYMQQNIWKS